MTTDKTPSPYYRVANRAIILDELNRILVVREKTGLYALPGGGWEHDESFESGLKREIAEELGVEIASFSEQVVCMYRGVNSRGKMSLRIAVRANLVSIDFKPDDEDVVSAEWLTRAEFMNLDLSAAGEEEIKQYADIIWSENG